MLVMAEQDKRANLLVVSLTQTSRIIFVVVLVPFISYFFMMVTCMRMVGVNKSLAFYHKY